jgi:hypothetical protein
MSICRMVWQAHICKTCACPMQGDLTWPGALSFALPCLELAVSNISPTLVEQIYGLCRAPPASAPQHPVLHCSARVAARRHPTCEPGTLSVKVKFACWGLPACYLRIRRCFSSASLTFAPWRDCAAQDSCQRISKMYCHGISYDKMTKRILLEPTALSRHRGEVLGSSGDPDFPSGCVSHPHRAASLCPPFTLRFLSFKPRGTVQRICQPWSKPWTHWYTCGLGPF